ncbi:MAG TPA: DUF1622 domain-containing protein [Candidatus Nitrosocosmicus sp.]|nr:DUF1622 domain-containing protein [Candidatus Nitrosocosmicus sp.]
MIETPEIFQIAVEYIVLIIEVIVAIIISGIIIITLFIFFKTIISKLQDRRRNLNFREIVTKMLRGLLIAADFLIAADLLKSILDPTLEDALVLTLIVILRILLSWSLSKEIEMQSKSDKKANSSTSAS